MITAKLIFLNSEGNFQEASEDSNLERRFLATMRGSPLFVDAGGEWRVALNYNLQGVILRVLESSSTSNPIKHERKHSDLLKRSVSINSIDFILN